ncbi:hypothetical protein [Aridibaculum aurantiacum]|uniref:hypothetical protein n=1 Tax=Aridibaculum aurantiacum TaxID=2810307 RepID=UPI001A96695D|nr:hypothetical protein [Aridibaculum aurantiacum]
MLKKDNVSIVPLIDGRYIDPDGDEIVDSAALVDGITKSFPGVKAKGIGILDWEGKTFDQLKECPVGSVCFNAAIEKFLTVLRIAKATRPNVRWGFYYIPFTFYWQKDLREPVNNKLIKLLKQCDILLPSLYDFYPDRNIHQQNENYHKNNMEVVMKLAHQLKKPVYVFIWHRWHNSNAEEGLQAIPTEEFQQHLGWIVNSGYKGKKPNGVIWFSAEKYYYQQKPSAFKEVKGDVQDALDAVFKDYYTIIKTEVKKVGRKG